MVSFRSVRALLSLSFFSVSLVMSCEVIFNAQSYGVLDKKAIQITILVLMALLLSPGTLNLRKRYLPILSVLLLLLNGLFFVVIRAFGKLNYNALIATLNDQNMAAGIRIISRQISEGFTLTLLMSISVIGILNIFYTYRFFKIRIATAIAFPLATLGLSSVPFDLIRGFSGHNGSSEIHVEYIKYENKTTPTKLDDVIFVYMEGMDRRYALPSVSKITSDFMRNVEYKGISFTNIHQITGTEWSIAGLISSQCGVSYIPYGLIGLRSNQNDIDDFLKPVNCLSDVLRNSGYKQYFFQGYPMHFQSYNKFVQGHGFDYGFGRYEIESENLPGVENSILIETYYDDQQIFELAEVKIEQLINKDNPFAITIMTAGPHGVSSHVSRSCTVEQRPKVTDDPVLAAECLVTLVDHFMGEIYELHAKADRGRELKFVILSDHLAHGAAKLPKDDINPRNFVTLIAREGGGNVIDRAGSMVDLYPTLLEWLGFDIPQKGAGLGRSLFNHDELTLVEAYGIKNLNEMLMNAQDLAKLIWVGR